MCQALFLLGQLVSVSMYVVTGMLMQKKAKDVGCGKLAADLQCVFYLKKNRCSSGISFLMLLLLEKGDVANVL